MKRVKKLLLQFCKFGLVGTLCFCIDYGLMILLTELYGASLFYILRNIIYGIRCGKLYTEYAVCVQRQG